MSDLCNHMACGMPGLPVHTNSWVGSSIHGIFQARELQWDAIAFSLGLLLCKGNWERLVKHDATIWKVNLLKGIDFYVFMMQKKYRYILDYNIMFT